MTNEELPFIPSRAAAPETNRSTSNDHEFTSGASALLLALARARLVEAQTKLTENDPTDGGWARISFAIPTDAYAVLAYRATDERLLTSGRRTQNDLALEALRAFLSTAPREAAAFLATVPSTRKRARGDRPTATTLTVRLPIALNEFITALSAFSSTTPAQLVAAAIFAAKSNKVWES